MKSHSVAADILYAGGLKPFLLPFVQSQVALMLGKIDKECLQMAQELSLMVDTLNLQGLNIQGINNKKPLVE
jgi:hypothetical protein